MRIAITSSHRAVLRDKLVQVVRAIERQVREDFAPVWAPKGAGVEIVVAEADGAERIEDEVDAVVYVRRSIRETKLQLAPGQGGADGRRLPWGVVYPDLERALGEPWTRTLSHEVLELIADPTSELFARRPHPASPDFSRLHPYEICDPVCGDGYEIDGCEVANFVTPLYFADLPEPVHTPTNFLNLALPRFGVRPRGFYCYFDARTGEPGEFCSPGNESAAMLRIALSEGRRRVRARQALRASRAYAIESSRWGSGRWSCAPRVGDAHPEGAGEPGPAALRGSA